MPPSDFSTSLHFAPLNSANCRNDFVRVGDVEMELRSLKNKDLTPVCARGTVFAAFRESAEYPSRFLHSLVRFAHSARSN